MDTSQDKILSLQLLENKIKDYPARLLNSLKFTMDFDKDFDTKAAVQQRIRELSGIKDVLEQFLKQAQFTQSIKDEVVRSAEGNRAYFDQLLVQHGISEQEVTDIVGEFTSVPEDRTDTGYASSVGGSDLPDDDDEEELSYELRKGNLAELSKFSHKNSINLD